jgi:hypothetical protein
LTSVNCISTGESFQRWLFGDPYNVDQDTIRVLINNVFWTPGQGTFVKYLANDTVFVATTSPDGKVLLLFGNGIYGVVPPTGSTINVLYTTTVGSQGNSASIGDVVQLLDVVEISSAVGIALSGVSTTVTSGGVDEEDLDSIKYVTPRLYASSVQLCLCQHLRLPTVLLTVDGGNTGAARTQSGAFAHRAMPSRPSWLQSLTCADGATQNAASRPRCKLKTFTL